MAFADARSCPSCRGTIDQVSRCPHCGLDLTTHEIQQAWQALVVADQWVERARSLQAADVPAAAGPTVQTDPLPQHAPSQALREPPVTRRRSISAGSVLLALGALFILVAGSIFVTISWGDLGVLGRALVLLAVTALFGVVGWFVTRRGLRASSEAVWTVFLGLVTLDWFAARDQGLAGLDSWAFGASATTWAALVIGSGLLIVRVGRRHLSTELLAPSIIGGGAAWFAAASLGAELGERTEREFWPGVLATAVVLVAWVVTRRGSMRVGSWICLAGAGVYGVFAIGAAVVDAIEHPALGELVGDAHGVPLLLVVVVAVIVGVVLSPGRPVASAIAVAGVGTLICLPIEEAWPARGGFVSVAVLLALGSWAVAQHGEWFRGARLTVTVATLGLAVASTQWGIRLLAVVAEGATGPRADRLSTRLRPDELPDAGPWWLVLVVGAGFVSVIAAARRWPEFTPAREHVVPVAWTVGAAAALAAEATTLPPAVSVGSAILVAGALLSVVLVRRHHVWAWVGPTVIAAAPLATLSSWPAAVVVWPLAGVALAAVAILADAVLLRAGSAFVATAWGLGTTAAVLELLDVDDEWTALGLVISALIGLLIGLLTVRDLWAHRAVEAAATLLGVTGLGIVSADSTLGLASLIWTAAGAGVVMLGLVSSRRRWYGWVGSALLGVAYVLRLAASDVEVVEAYTLPFAAFLLAVGLWAMRHEDGPGSVRALLPGVLLALLPSLPQALDEPTGLRALLLGVGAAIALTVGTWRRWKVPFIAGALVLALLVLVNVGPLTLAMPRWVLIASVGAVLLAAGITWDDRVRDGRAVIRYVGSMR